MANWQSWLYSILYLHSISRCFLALSPFLPSSRLFFCRKQDVNVNAKVDEQRGRGHVDAFLCSQFWTRPIDVANAKKCMKHPCISQMATKTWKIPKWHKKAFFHGNLECNSHIFAVDLRDHFYFIPPKIGNREKMHLYNLIKKFYYRFHLLSVVDQKNFQQEKWHWKVAFREI